MAGGSLVRIIATGGAAAEKGAFFIRLLPIQIYLIEAIVSSPLKMTLVDFSIVMPSSFKIE